MYWAGAAFALEADLRLREDGGRGDTLLATLRRAGPTWARDVHPVGRSAFLRALDPSGSLEALGEAYLARSAFPDTDRLLSPAHRARRDDITKRDEDACGISAEAFR